MLILVLATTTGEAARQAKVDEVMHDVRTSVAFADTGKDAYVAASGTADIVNDRRLTTVRYRAPGSRVWEDKSWDGGGGAGDGCRCEELTSSWVHG